MSKPGPAKTPTALLDLHGSWRAKQRGDMEPEFEDGVPKCPDWLRDEAKIAWNHLIPKLAAVPGLLKSVDENALARYVQTWAKWRACEEFIMKNGDVFPIRGGGRIDSEGNHVPGPVKDMKQYPQVNTAIKLQSQLEATEKQFGLTPSARASLSVGAAPKKDNQNPFDTRN